MTIRNAKLDALLTHLREGDFFYDVQLPSEQAHEVGWRLRRLHHNIKVTLTRIEDRMAHMARRMDDARRALANGHPLDTNLLGSGSEELAALLAKLAGLEELAELLLRMGYPEQVDLWLEYSQGQAVDSEAIGRYTAAVLAAQAARADKRRTTRSYR